MRALLDVNVLIALLDADHVSHAAARSWFQRHGGNGWASCPSTQNGCVRVMSHPGYPNHLPVSVIAHRLRDATRNAVHEFWPDDQSVLDEERINVTRVLGPKQLTDVYLLALAVSRGGRFVTFDGAVSMAAVIGARSEHVVQL